MPHITGQPVRRLSRQRGRCEIWRPIDRRTAQRIVLAARRFELARKPWGRENGPLGYIALEVLALLANTVDFRTGRLEPSYDWITSKLKRSHDAVGRALKALKAHGFLDWLRRFEPTDCEGRGPQVRQVTNAYRLALPLAAVHALGAFGPPPIPDDVEAALAARSVAVAAYEKDEAASSPLADSLARLGASIKQRESAARREPVSVVFS